MNQLSTSILKKIPTLIMGLIFSLSLMGTKAYASCGIHAKLTFHVSGYTAYFNDSSYTTGTIIAFHYLRFGDSSSSSTVSPTHKYKHKGKFPVTLYVMDSTHKCIDSVKDTVVINPKNCGAAFSYTYSGLNYSFTNSSYVSGGKASYHWYFGDGTTDTAANPKHTYSSTAGAMTVSLVVDNGLGCKDSTTEMIVPNCGIHCYYTYAVSGALVHFYDSSYSSGSKITRYYWSFGDTSSATTKNPDHTYKHTGKFAVVHYAIDSLSKCYVSYIDTIVITSVPTTTCGLHAHNKYSISGASVSFTDSSYSTGSTGVASYYWGFGDSTSSTSANPSHTYLHNGKFLVVEYVFDSAKKCYSRVVDSITITGVTTCGLHAGFSDSVAGKTVYFHNTSYTTGKSISNYYWSFGDSTTATATSPNHTYTYNGTFKVILYIWDSVSKCSSSYSTSITIGTSTATYDIKGYVYEKGVGMADYATVYLIYYKTTDSTLNLIDSTSIVPADSGMYHFGKVSPGKYLVKAALTSSATNYKKFLPTYYHSSMHWDSAKYVTITTGTGYAGIFMIAGSNPGGAGFIGGKVSAGANKVGDPVANVEVQLYDASNNLVAFTYSDINGNYSFSNLAYGNYTVWPEALGKITTSASITIDAGTPSIGNVGITVDTKAISAAVTGIENNSQLYFSARVYPNPAKEGINMDFVNLVNAKTNISIIDAMGRTVYSQVLSLSIGKQSLHLNTEALNNGLYIIKVLDQKGNFENNYRFIKAN